MPNFAKTFLDWTHLLKSKKSKVLFQLKISTKIFGFYISLQLG